MTKTAMITVMLLSTLLMGCDNLFQEESGNGGLRDAYEVATNPGSSEEQTEEDADPSDSPDPTDGGDDTPADAGPVNLDNGDATSGGFAEPIGRGTSTVYVRELPLTILNPDPAFQFSKVYTWGDADATYMLIEVKNVGQEPVIFLRFDEFALYDSNGSLLETGSTYVSSQSVQSKELGFYTNTALLPDQIGVMIEISLDYGYTVPGRMEATINYLDPGDRYQAPSSRFELSEYALTDVGLEFSFANTGAATMALDDSHITVLYGADGPIDWTFADVASTAVAAGGTSYLVDDFYYISDASDDLAYGVAIFPEYGDLGIESSSVPREHPHYELFREEAEDRRLKVEAYNAAEKRE